MTAGTGIDQERTFYDARWQAHQGRPLADRRLARASAILAELARLNLPAPRVIDLGAGTGLLSGMLALLGPVTAVELSPRAVEEAQRRFPDVHFIAGDFFALDLPRNSFDVVVSQEVIEHVGDQAAYLRLAHELLAPRGYLVLTTPNRFAMHASGDFERQQKRGSLQPRENLLSVSQLRRLVRKQFTIERCYTMIREGRRGLLRIVNSHKLNRIRAWSALMDQLSLGLHTVVVARAK